jgi:hypothetical protein
MTIFESLVKLFPNKDENYIADLLDEIEENYPDFTNEEIGITAALTITKQVKTKPMSGQEIADQYNTTRQNISNFLKRGMTKLYEKSTKFLPDASPYEIALIIGNNVLKVGDDDMGNFFKLFPPKIRKEITESAKNFKIDSLQYFTKVV